MKVCPKCSAEFEDQLSFCRQDGTALKLKPAQVICPSCGGEVEAGQRFCRHCGGSLESSKTTRADENLVTAPVPKASEEVTSVQPTQIEQAEDHLKALDAIVKANPQNQEARLTQLYATVKLYNIYGYEKQIESLRSLSDLNEKEREIVKEIFLIRVDDAQKRGKTDEAREYQRLATRVILGQPLVESTPERPIAPAQAEPQEQARQTISPQAETRPRSSARTSATRLETTPLNAPDNTRTKKSSRLVVSFAIVFGLAAILALGMLAHYANKRGVNVSDIFTRPTSPLIQDANVKPELPMTSASGQVLAAEELGFKVWGTGAADANRQESIISERIGTQLKDIRELYQREVQNKPELMGSLILQLTVSPAGGVTKVEEFAARVRDDSFKKAILNEVYKWSFPEAGGGLTKINYPLLFVPPKMDVATVLQWEKGAGVGRPPPSEVKGDEQLAGQKNSSDSIASSGVNNAGLRGAGQPGTGAAREQTKTSDPVASNPQEAPKPKTVRTLPEGPFDRPIVGQYEILFPTTVFREPRDDSPLVARIEAGTKVNVVEAHGEWLEVRSKQGRPPGYIKKDAATPLSTR